MFVFKQKKMPELQKCMKSEDVSCVHVHVMYGGGAQVGDTVLNNFHFVGKIWSFAYVFEKWLNVTARLTSATTKI